jgi:hypothetical protein
LQIQPDEFDSCDALQKSRPKKAAFFVVLKQQNLRSWGFWGLSHALPEPFKGLLGGFPGSVLLCYQPCSENRPKVVAGKQL